MSEVLVTRPAPGVALVRLNAPARKNALTGAMARELIQALTTVEHDTDIGAVVVSGGPESYCAGAHRDLLSGVSVGDAQSEQDITAVYDIFAVVRSLRPVTVAAVCGPAVGAGLNLALACGVRVVGDNALLRSMFVPNHIHPAGGHLRMLRDIGGRSLAVRLAVLDEPLDAGGAVDSGLAIGPVPAAETENFAVHLMRRAAAVPSLARTINESVTAVETLDDTAAAQFEAEAQRFSLRTRDGD